MTQFDRAIRDLLLLVEERFGHDQVALLSESDPHSLWFRLNSVAATISIHTQEGSLPPTILDVQVEGLPPGEYLLTDVVSVQTLFAFICRIASSPEEKWPHALA